jgi:DNA-binding response OmpR family regulator
MKRAIPKILIADDKEANVHALLDLLEDIEAECITCNSGNDAVALALQHDFALILLDVQMPEMDGFEALKFIRMEEKNRFVPVLFLSAVYTSIDFQVKGIISGAIDFIIKPIEPALLLGKVDLLLDHYRHIEEQKRSSALIRATLDATADGIVVFDTENRLTHVNQQFFDIWKIHLNGAATDQEKIILESMRGQTLKPAQFVESFFSGKGLKYRNQVELLELTGERYLELTIKQQIVDDTVVGCVYSFKDVTTQKQLEEQNERFLEDLAKQNVTLAEQAAHAKLLYQWSRENKG